MNVVDYYQTTCSLYEYLFIKVSGYRNYTFSPTISQDKQIENFLNLIDKKYKLINLGEDWFWDYFIFQFQQRDGQKTRMGKGVVMLNWVIGQKSVETWERRQKNYLYFNDLFINRYNINREEIFKKTAVKQKNNDDLIRKLYYNTGQGYINCVELTTLFDPKSEYCKNCYYNEECKRLLKDIYPLIYKMRNESL